MICMEKVEDLTSCTKNRASSPGEIRQLRFLAWRTPLFLSRDRAWHDKQIPRTEPGISQGEKIMVYPSYIM